MSARSRAVVPGIVLLAALWPVATASAAGTVRVSSGDDGKAANANVFDAALSGNGTTSVFASAASNLGAPDLGGPIADIFGVNLTTGGRRLISGGLDGAAADGPSSAPTVSAVGRVTAFVSSATNLVPEDTNATFDVFAAELGAPTVRVSVASDGGQADGPSFQPDISADGRHVAFTSLATNLVPEDTNGTADVFVRDLLKRTTRRVSLGAGNTQGRGRSSSPAINADGTVVVFESAAADLVVDDVNRTADVFLRVVALDRTELVSVSTAGFQQDRSVTAPFTAAPDVSADGRYVVFDTEARNLYRLDLNRRADVYLRDRLSGETVLVSASSVNVQGDNDSVTPRITPNGRFVTFQSFASNLVPDDGPREDVFVRDLRNATTALASATDSGSRRAAEPGGTLLQRPSIADDGRAATFVSAAPGIVGDGFGLSTVQLYRRDLRAAAAPTVSRVKRTTKELRLRVGGAETATNRRRFLCRVDRAAPYYCGPNVVVSRQAGRVLGVREAGPGQLWSSVTLVRIAG